MCQKDSARQSARKLAEGNLAVRVLHTEIRRLSDARRARAARSTPKPSQAATMKAHGGIEEASHPTIIIIPPIVSADISRATYVLGNCPARNEKPAWRMLNRWSHRRVCPSRLLCRRFTPRIALAKLRQSFPGVRS